MKEKQQKINFEVLLNHLFQKLTKNIDNIEKY